MGKRLTTVTILSGSVVRVWGTLERILEQNQLSLSKSDRTMRVVRVELEAGEHLVGGSSTVKKCHAQFCAQTSHDGIMHAVTNHDTLLCIQ